jgi:hypothetical protein
LALLLFKLKIEIYKDSINNNMPNKFLNLVEQKIKTYSESIERIDENLVRGINGGKLMGDIVKFVKNYKSKDSYKSLGDDIKGMIDNIAKSDLNIRVVEVKPMFPSHATGNDQNRGNAFAADIAVETAPGRYDSQNKFTVPIDLLTVDNDYINLAKVPDSFKKKEKINHKPVAPEEDEEVLNNPYVQTLMSQDGSTLRRTETKLLNKNVKIPAVTAKGAASPEVKGFSKVYTPLSPTIKN